ncbi:MAG: M56 family metallopeptidase, partial [Olleya sp.]
MELILLKSSACLLALLLFYKIALEPLSVNKLKRAYLLVAILVSAVIPFVTFIKYVDATFDFGTFDPNSMNTPPYFPAELPSIIEEEPINYLPIFLWSIYGLGVAVFLVRFCLNLFGIVSKIRTHTKVKDNLFVNVLMEQLEIPHTFFNFIFLNKNKFENNQIPAEVLLHEQTHAIQKHSLDILLLELIQIVFWFNPLLYWLKKEVKLNHEFLADQNVINQGIEAKTYQNILLQFSSNQQELALANAINYSSIKKRFTLMKTQTPKPTIWLRSILLIPLLGLLIYGFSSTKEVEKELT